VPASTSAFTSSSVREQLRLDRNSSRAQFFFTFSRQLPALLDRQSAQKLLMPRGFFERLVGRVVAYCLLSGGEVDDMWLRKEVIQAHLGNQTFRLWNCEELNCVELEVEGSPLKIANCLEELVKDILKELFVNLSVVLAVPLPANSTAVSVAVGVSGSVGGNVSTAGEVSAAEYFIPINRIYAVQKDISSVIRIGSAGNKLNWDAVKTSYGEWLEQQGQQDAYMYFISYRWYPWVKTFALALHDRLSIST